LSTFVESVRKGDGSALSVEAVLNYQPVIVQERVEPAANLDQVIQAFANPDPETFEEPEEVADCEIMTGEENPAQVRRNILQQ
jgi:hypothetical protein